MKHFATFAIILFSIFAQAQNKLNYQLQLNSGIFTPPENVNEIVKHNFSVTNNEFFGEHFYRYIQFYEIPDNSQREALKNEGIDLILYLPNYTYIAAISKQTNGSVLQNFNIRSVITPTAKLKMQPQLFAGTYPEYSLTSDGRIKLNVLYYSSINDKALLQTLETKYTVISQNIYADVVTLSIPISEIMSFVNEPFVCYLEPIDPPSEKENNGGRTNHRSNVISTDDPLGRKYNGSGVNVMLQDDGIIGPHIDYTGRIGGQFITFNNGNHGDHCGGIIMSGGNLNPLGKGMGWGATLFVYEAAPAYQGFDSIYTHYSNLGIVITSTSYSNGCNAGYTTLTQKLDQQIRTMSSLMHVFSAGNNGTADCSYGAGAGWGNITGGHKMGKNCITVGNLDSLDNLNSSSSRGPGTDGRLKPEVCAVGTNVMSTIDPNTYANFTGTSMSCPGTAGTLAQLYQAYRQLNGNQNPNSALIKAILMNSCDDLGNPGPDFKFGYGRINALRAVRYIEQNTYISSSVNHNATNNHTINVPGNTKQVRIMLYWHDFEAAPNANPALVNNLNMLVTDPSSNSFSPWILDPTPNSVNLNTNAIRGIDNLNNHEQITIDNPQAGAYTISINGFNVPQGPQAYYIVYEFIDDAITVTYPIGGEGLNQNENQRIKWDAFETTGTFTIEFTSDNGSTWTTLSSNVNGAQRNYLWTTPSNIVSGQCRIRISRNSVSDESDANFSIIGIPQNIQINWACPDSLLLTWNNVNGASGYEISKLGTMYMDSIGTSTTNSFVVHNVPANGTYWFSVKALGPLDAKGRRANAIQKTPGTFNCTLAIDANLLSVISPLGNLQTCQILNATTISVQLKNEGTTTLTNIPLHYQVNNNPVVNEIYNGSLTQQATLNYNFTTTTNFSTAGIYNLKVWTTYSGDGNIYNDTVTQQITVTNVNAVNLPWSENFETFTPCPETSDCEITNCTLNNGWQNITNGNGDDIDWRTDEGGTPSANTGPTIDHNPGTATGNYLYLEASNCFNKTALLISPCIDLSLASSPYVVFYYHMYGGVSNNMGELHLDALVNGQWVNDIMTPITGNQGNNWIMQGVSLMQFSGQIINLRFRGITGAGYASDMAIDDIYIEPYWSIEENNFSQLISVYPNPANNLVTISSNEVLDGTIKIEIIDLVGKKLLSKDVKIKNETLNTTIDISKLLEGTYFIKLTNESGKTRVVKIAKL